MNKNKRWNATVDMLKTDETTQNSEIETTDNEICEETQEEIHENRYMKG